MTFLVPIFFVYSCNIGLYHVNVFLTYFLSFPNHVYLHFSVLWRLLIAVSATRRFTVTQSCHRNQSIVLKGIITFSSYGSTISSYSSYPSSSVIMAQVPSYFGNVLDVFLHRSLTSIYSSCHLFQICHCFKS